MALANQTGLSDKYVSERHHYASQHKQTAGEAAKILSKKLGTKIYAKDVINAYKVIYNDEPEWHHAGFYKNNGKSNMGRTFFFSEEEIETLTTRWTEVTRLLIEKEKELESYVYGFYYYWDQDYSGYRGKKRNYKVLAWYEGPLSDIPKNFTSCDQVFYENHKHIKVSYYGWDEPSISDIESKN